jgi:D-alanyl-D-alanine carboxypeptidase/D-alanyl-D-alanine-endopeptidase (penicillin-binding protein 4)
LAVVTGVVVLLDVTGVIFDPPDSDTPQPLVVPATADVAALLPQPVAEQEATASKGTLAQVRALLTDDAVGDSVSADVLPLFGPTNGSALLDLDAQANVTPASTLKLLTALAALDELEPTDRLQTATVFDNANSRVVLVGGGDSTLTSQSLARLAKATAQKLRHDDVSSVKVGYDSSLFEGPAVSPHWEDDYTTTGVIAPVTALMVDEGRITADSVARFPDPAAAAASSFSAMLENDGVEVRGGVAEASVAAADKRLAFVTSAPLVDLVERMLRESDNQLAESLGRLAAAASGQPASFKGEVKTLRQSASRNGVSLADAHIFDASGLSRGDAVSAVSLGSVLRVAAAEPDLRPLFGGLPVAGFDGTLFDRFEAGQASAAAGLVRAKTGTLTGVSAEIGIATTCSGSPMAYAFIADAVPDTLGARLALDRAAAVLTQCPGTR